jgi:y4mF family transcriptional regulator
MIPIGNIGMIEKPLKRPIDFALESLKQQSELTDFNKLINRAVSGMANTTRQSATMHDGRQSITTTAQLGALIKAARKSQGLTQQQFADLAGVGRRFIVECEAGKPRLEFAKVLQVAASAGIDIFAVKR